MTPADRLASEMNRLVQFGRCIVSGCVNEVVREYHHKDGGRGFAVCAFHGQTIIRYGTDEQVHGYVFPDVKVAP